jgi:hypothetical protein
MKTEALEEPTDVQRLAKALRLALREIADLKNLVHTLEFPDERWECADTLELDTAVSNLAMVEAGRTKVLGHPSDKTTKGQERIT